LASRVYLTIKNIRLKLFKTWVFILKRNQKVKVELFNEEVQIIGIDEFGYLKVKKQDNRLDILQPDGNRFDYMHNLIALRNSL